MKQSPNLLFCLFSLFVLSSCGNSSAEIYYADENATKYEKKAVLKYFDDIALEADKSTTSALSGTDVFSDSKTGKKYVAFLSPGSKSIIIYDLDTKKCVNKIPVYDDGPNNTGPMTTPAMHKLLSLDSVLYFNFGNLYLLNSQGNVLKKFNNVSSRDNSVNTKPNPGTYAPIIKSKDDVYLIGGYNSEQKNQSGLRDLLKINIKTGKKTELFNRSKIYDYGFWGYNLNLYFLYGTLNTSTEELILGYAAEPMVYSYNLKKERVEHKRFLGSEHFKEVYPFLKNRAEFNPKADAETIAKSAEHEISNPSYYSILYDEKSNTYIRVAFMPKSRADYNDPIKRYKFKCTFIVFDKNFNKIGEDILPDASTLDFRIMYMNDGYLHIFNKVKYNRDNDHLYFDRYKLEFN